jgi:flotillin
MMMADGAPATVGFRIVKGGGAFIWPVFERADTLSLELMTLEVKTPEVYTSKGVPILVDGIAQVKVKGDDVSIATAGEQFLSKGQGEIMQIALQTVEGHLRAIMGTLTVEEAYSNRDMFARQVQEVAASDLANMGLTIVSFTIRDIRDNQGYLDALGKPRTAEVKRDATIGEAEAARDATIRSAQANQEGQTAKFLADTKIAESERDYKSNVAMYTAAVNQKKAEADLAYDLQKFKTQQSVRAEEVQVDVVEKTKQIQVQEQEILRKEKELSATVHKPADAERYRVETLANAEQFRLSTTAQGEAEAIRVTGVGEADATKAKGLAQADVIRAQGFAEAEAMAKKADAWRQYNEAAITNMFIDKLPDIASAIAQPLSKTDRIVVVNSGGDSAGASKVTKDVTNIVAQLPPMIEALTGMKLDELVSRIPQMGERSKESSAGEGAAPPKGQK